MQFNDWKASNEQNEDEQPLLNRVVQENIRTLVEHRKAAVRRRSAQDRVADGITRFSGSMIFVYIHIIWFTAWILLNSGVFDNQPFDPFPYGLLTMVVSLEAIFLSTFVLVSQNRMSEQDKQRAELDLQINLLTERELTHVLIMLHDIQEHLGMKPDDYEELSSLEEQTRPDEILKAIEEVHQEEENGVETEPEEPAV